MPDQHIYDDDLAERLAAIYTAPETVDRRGRLLALLDLDAGVSVLCIGCGPGYEPVALADLVGEHGRVHGIDNSADILAMAEERCAGLPGVTLERADATDLPVSDEGFDAGVASLVFEYCPDIDTAVAELYRALRPGGRAGIVSTDWDSMVWHSSDADRMDRVIAAWKDVYAHPRLGSQLGSHLRGAGFDVEHVEPFTNLQTDLEGYGGLTLDLFKAQLESHERFGAADIEAWERDLRELEAAGDTFLNVTYYLYLVEKPG